MSRRTECRAVPLGWIAAVAPAHAEVRHGTQAGSKERRRRRAEGAEGSPLVRTREAVDAAGHRRDGQVTGIGRKQHRGRQLAASLGGAELLQGVREEAHKAGARAGVLAQLSAVLSRMEPALKDS